MDENMKNELSAIREQISSLDREGLELLKRRLEISARIGRLKLKNGAPVLDPDREKAVIREAQSRFEPDQEHRIESLMNTLMRISRESQYDILMEKDLDWMLGKAVRQASAVLPPPAFVAFQGTLGSYSHLTAQKLFPEAELIPSATFGEACSNVLSGECGIAVLPLENTTAGIVDDVAGLLAEEPVYIVGTVSVPIRHCLMTIPGSGLERIQTVLSHPQGLAQCSKWIKKMGWTPVAVENTAFAARQVKEKNDPSCAAIASAEAARFNGLSICGESVADSPQNQTRFALVSKNLIIPDRAERISITFRLAHQTGSLAHVLNLFAERGLNLTKIQSRPMPERPWEYSFWVDLVAKKAESSALLALYQLSAELPSVKLLGWYEDICLKE